MPRTYSLREIREAGVYAWHPLGGEDLYHPHLVYRGISDDVLVAVRDVAGDEEWGGVCPPAQVPQDGWCHLDDCGCPLCRGVSLTLDSWQAEAEWREPHGEPAEPLAGLVREAPGAQPSAGASLLDAVVDEADALQNA